MRSALPGKPRAKLQAVCTGYWDDRRLLCYITGNAFVILTGHDAIHQTVYDDDEQHLEAIAIDEASGKIATCSGANLRVYKPYGQGEDALKWSLQHSFTIQDRKNNGISTLSWGMSEELLVGGDSIFLYNTHNTLEEIWKSPLANHVKFAHFTYDSAYIASTGRYDRLVKIWRRLSFASDDTRFEISYLSHPATVTNIHWRRPFHQDQTIDNVLYTLCADHMLRVWSATDAHGPQVLQLWSQIDLTESIQPPILATGSELRFAFIINGRDFILATEHAVQSREASEDKNDHGLAHLIEVANRTPEICIVLDGQGRMSAWGLENVGVGPRQTTNIFNVAHVDGLNIKLPQTQDDLSYIQLYNFCNKSGGGLNLLVHHFDGKIEVFESDVAKLFDPSPRTDRFVSKASWTGHSESIKKIVRDVSGRAIFSRTDGTESILWKHVDLKDGTSVVRQSTITQDEHVHRICVLRQGRFVIFLHHNSIALWDTGSSMAQLLAICKYEAVGKPLCILILPEIKSGGSIAHVATVTSKMNGIVWEVQLPLGDGHSTTKVNRNINTSIREFCRFDLGSSDGLSYVLPVDPAGSPPVTSGFLDTFARDIAISYTTGGLLRSWTARVDKDVQKVDWLETCSVDTGIRDSALASGSSIRKAALVNASRSELTIWDVRGAQLEFSENYEAQDTIQDLDWTSTPDDQSILAVGFRFRVLLLAQMRFDYLNKGPAWAAVQEFNIRDLTPHPIGDSTWLTNGNLVIGAGNQFFVYAKEVDQSAPIVTNLGLPRRKTPWDLFEVVTRFNGPLPVYHPQFLGQCTLSGKTVVVQKILLALHKILKYYVEGDAIDTHLGMDLENFYFNTPTSTAATKSVKSFGAFTDEDKEVETVTEGVAAAITEKLTNVALPQLSRQEQIHLADIVECVAIVEKQRRSMDGNAARYMLFFRQHALRRGRSHEVPLSWREINWAYHSNSQDILVEVVSHQSHGKLLWEHARESGMFMWMTDLTALKAQFEVIARNEYTKSDMKNPIDCSLYYLALKKKTVLQGLWRMAGWNREQGATVRLLSNNFQEKKWKTAAMKNAYALLGKHRFEYAAAFFLLADCLKDAVNVILNQLKDLQLAITVTRVYEGERGPVLKELLEEKVLPLAAQEGNRWLASWAFWMLHRRDMSVRALISPVYTLLETPHSPDLQSKLFLTDDPALVVLYSQLRQTTLQTLRGALKVTPKVEWAFVLHNARLYDRMGCDLLALDLVRNWEFLQPAQPGFQNIVSDPRQLLRRRSSLVVADEPVIGKNMLVEMKSGGMHKPPPSVFEEPEASSLLDSFGF
ncbi:WD repeat protein-like protein [Calycina marina]|uniref:WD repeat protein-like protein n=1 Tax=Calycina marina TaxID=1763456 RepID=A0A9P7YZX5_9HELO|nr:WD repeat protein-like protein [Calycina marina]